MTTLSPSPARRSRLVRAAAGLGVATAMLGTAGAAIAAPVQHASTTPIVRSASHGASIQLPAGKVKPGSRITITGDAPLDAPTGQWLTFSSVAFASTHTVNGIPAVRTQVNAQGTYSVTAKIKSNIRRYNDAAIMGSYRGTPFQQVGWMHLDAGLNGTVHVIYHNARGTAAPGTKVILVGDSPSSAPGGLRSGDRLTFDSTAFAGPATAMITAQGTYQISPTIAPGTKPGTYSVNGSYRGMPFKSSSSVTVVR